MEQNETANTDLMNFEYEEIHDFIFVYNKLLPNHEEIYRSLRESKARNSDENFYAKWTPWYSFGSMALIKEGDGDPEISNFERRCYRETTTAIHEAMRHYQGVNGISDPNTGDELPILTMPGPCTYHEYSSNSDINDPKAMSYHVDFMPETVNFPGEKFMITSCTYPNDDYEGGEIEFWADGKAIKYKPKAGDILVFPSGNPIFPGDGRPYFHSVCATGKGEKWLFRSFAKYADPVTPEWEAGVEKYGEGVWKEKLWGAGDKKKDGYSKAGASLMMFGKGVNEGVPTISKELFDAYGGNLKGDYVVGW
jgi:hypothetical protein